MKILILTNGFVLVVESIEFVGNYIKWPRALNVRRWREGAGLGRLAIEGPRLKGAQEQRDVLDPEPSGQVHEMLVVRMMDIEPAAQRAYDGLLHA
jgi:hypothetical protein